LKIGGPAAGVVLLVIGGAEAGSSTETPPLPLRQELIGRLSVDLNVIPPVDAVCSAARAGLDLEHGLATTETSLALPMQQSPTLK